MSIQLKFLRDYNGYLKNHIYNFSEEDENAKKMVDYGCAHTKEGLVYEGTGNIAIYYSKDRDDLDGTQAPIIQVPEQLKEYRLLKVSDDKKPYELAWQKTNNTLNDPVMREWIEGHEKYGVLCGWNSLQDKFLVVIDFDNKEIQDAVMESESLPETFTVQTARKGLLHLYFYSKTPINKWKILTKDKETLADIQGSSTQVIGPGSRIPDGRMYRVVVDAPIAEISVDELHRALDRFNPSVQEETLKVVEDGLTLSDFEKNFGRDEVVEEIKRKLKISDILESQGINTKHNPTRCPFHDSKGGKCLGFDDSKGIFNCFHCETKGDAITLWMLVHNVSDFVEAKEKLCEELGVENKPFTPPLPTPPPAQNNKPSIRLPEDNHTLAEFAEDLAVYFKNSDQIFFKIDERRIVEVTDHFDKQMRITITGIHDVEPKRLVNIIETKVNTFNFVKVKKGRVAVFRTPTEQVVKLLSVNSTFLDSLYQVKRFLSFPAPFVDQDKNLIIPKGVGFDERYQAYFTPNTPSIGLMSVEDAKKLLIDVFAEFCFKEPIDRDMAIAYAITPMCRGLYSEFNVRTPLFIIQANRERAGKDYLAGVVGTIYEGQAIDDTPFVTSDKSESNAEEWRKKFTSALKAGRRRIHSSNNRGFLANAVLEQFLTSVVWTDRQLGSNTTLNLSNEVDVSMSANIGLTYNADLWYRARPINLFYAEENPNERTYSRPDLHHYVRENRAFFLSAIYTLIKSWHDAGSPKGKVPFTSFAEWSRVVGGIMDYHGFLSPCIHIEDNTVGGDKETRGMKEFFTYMSDYQILHPDEYKGGFTINDMRRIIMHGVGEEELEGFAGWDLNDKSTQIKFGLLIKRFLNRTFHCNGERFAGKSTLVIRQNNNRSIRITYGFDLEGETTKGKINTNNINSEVEEESISEEGEFDKLVRLLSGVDDCNTNFLLVQGVTEKTIKKALSMGVCFEPRPGKIKLL